MDSDLEAKNDGFLYKNGCNGLKGVSGVFSMEDSEKEFVMRIPVNG
jgi:hypothetical protein